MRNFTITVLLLFIGIFTGFSQLNMTYKGNITYDEDLSDIWGYVAPDSTEYAIIGVETGVSIVELSDPENPTELFFIDGVSSIWRDIKTWGEYAYVTNETSNGVMVIDLTGLPDTATAVDWTPSIAGLGTLSSIHNIWIDEFGYAYLAGSNLNNGGIIYVDVFTTPGSPSYAGHGPSTYNHDVFVRENLMYSSEIYLGQFAIYDVTDKDTTTFLGSHNTESNFTHNAWLSDDGNTLYTSDEISNASIGSYDVSDPENIEELDQFHPYETLGDGVIPHNVHVWNDWLIISYYTDGCILVDGSNPSNLVEVGNFDTYIPSSTGFNGAWGAYPYLPSGLILVSDIGNGMYILEPNYVRACWLEGVITRTDDNSVLADATIEIVSTNVLDQSDLFGDYATGYAIAGTYDVIVSKPGFVSDTTSVVLQNDSTTLLDISLVPEVSFGFSGTVTSAENGDPIANANVLIRNGVFTYDYVTDMDGNFIIDEFFAGEYEVFAGTWGFHTVTMEGENFDDVNNLINLELETGYEDIFALDLGWFATNSAPQGDWERGVPIGTQPPGAPIYISPNLDVPEDAGNFCYVTGNTSDVNGGVLIGGAAKLTSPIIDLSDYETPYLSYYTWFFNLNVNTQAPGNGDMDVKINNGIDIVTVETLDYDVFEEVVWIYNEVDISSVITPTAEMTVIFDAVTPSNFSNATEAGIDYFRIWDAGVVGIGETVKESNLLLVAPNPSNHEFILSYKIDSKNNGVSINVFNAMGQLIDKFNTVESKGSLRIGGDYNPGLYILQLINGSEILKSIKIIKN
jgi:choice-of-anchor B domain-containing protein